MDRERIASLREADWIFCQIVEQLEWELFVSYRQRRRWEERGIGIWSYGQLRRTYACQNLPEDLRRETMACRASVAICIEPIVASGSIICNRLTEVRSRSRISLVLSFPRRHTRLRRCRADWGVAWRTVASGTSIRRRPSHWLFLSWIRLRHTVLTWDTVMCIISYDSRLRLVSVEGFWVSYVHAIIQLVLIQFLREMEGVFFQQDDARLPETLRQLPWPTSSPRLSPIEMHAGVWNWIELYICCILSATIFE